MSEQNLPTVAELCAHVEDEDLRALIAGLLQTGGDLDKPPEIDPNTANANLARGFSRLEQVLEDLAAALEILPEGAETWLLARLDSATIATGGAATLDAMQVRREVTAACNQLARLGALWNHRRFPPGHARQ